MHSACHSFPSPGTRDTQLAMLWSQRLSLRHKRAVCLQLEYVAAFSVLMD